MEHWAFFVWITVVKPDFFSIRNLHCKVNICLICIIMLFFSWIEMYKSVNHVIYNILKKFKKTVIDAHFPATVTFLAYWRTLAAPRHTVRVAFTRQTFGGDFTSLRPSRDVRWAFLHGYWIRLQPWQLITLKFRVKALNSASLCFYRCLFIFVLLFGN